MHWGECTVIITKSYCFQSCGASRADLINGLRIFPQVVTRRVKARLPSVPHIYSFLPNLGWNCLILLSSHPPSPLSHISFLQSGLTLEATASYCGTWIIHQWWKMGERNSTQSSITRCVCVFLDDVITRNLYVLLIVLAAVGGMKLLNSNCWRVASTPRHREHYKSCLFHFYSRIIDHRSDRVGYALKQNELVTTMCSGTTLKGKWIKINVQSPNSSRTKNKHMTNSFIKPASNKFFNLNK